MKMTFEELVKGYEEAKARYEDALFEEEPDERKWYHEMNYYAETMWEYYEEEATDYFYGRRF